MNESSVKTANAAIKEAFSLFKDSRKMQKDITEELIK